MIVSRIFTDSQPDISVVLIIKHCRRKIGIDFYMRRNDSKLPEIHERLGCNSTVYFLHMQPVFTESQSQLERICVGHFTDGQRNMSVLLEKCFDSRFRFSSKGSIIQGCIDYLRKNHILFMNFINLIKSGKFNAGYAQMLFHILRCQP